MQRAGIGGYWWCMGVFAYHPHLQLLCNYSCLLGCCWARAAVSHPQTAPAGFLRAHCCLCINLHQYHLTATATQQKLVTEIPGHCGCWKGTNMLVMALENGWMALPVGVSVLWQEQDTSMSQEVQAGTLIVCEGYLVLPVDFVYHHGDF